MPAAVDREKSVPKFSPRIELFRNAFKGRQDVVPQYWTSRKQGKRAKGYMPICRNKWADGCDLKKRGSGGCRTCENAGYVPLTNELIQAHLSGKRILGVYPLLTDGTCHFIAADFDRHRESDPGPLEELKKVFDVCEVQEVPCYVLRSKSGKGYHAYIFFKEAVPAWKARLVLFAILREAGCIGDDAEVSSFDRLFPNQDALSGKGFGNLIALPFQGKAARKGHTLFLNPETAFQDPYADQWEILRGRRTLSEADLDRIIAEWNLKREQPGRIGATDMPRDDAHTADFKRVIERCAFIQHCVDDAATLPEPDWYAFLSIAARCKDGRAMAHKHSEPHPEYSYSETEAKIEHALKDTGPFRCATIQKVKSKFCRGCEAGVTSPIGLGYLPRTEDAYAATIEEMNSKHAVVMVGGKCLIMNDVIDPLTGRPDFTLSTTGDFMTKYANRKIATDGQKKVSIAKLWLESVSRREYEGIIFEPGLPSRNGYYNLWQGLGVSPRKGEWHLFRSHIEQVIAGGNPKIAQWILAWMARIVQDPGGERPGTAIVLRGGQGTGKGIFVTTFGRVLGKHFLQVAQPSQVTGRFNHHLKDVILLFVDEGFWAGDRQAEGALKNLVTEKYVTIEQKGKDPIKVRNHVNMIIASNSSWVVPAGLDERRFFVLDVDEIHRQDHDYFKAVVEQMEHGGLEAMLFDLLQMDISKVDLRTFKKTPALLEQKIASMDSVQKYWLERLWSGTLLSKPIKKESVDYVAENGWPGIVDSDVQYRDYLDFAEILKIRYPVSSTAFGMELAKLCPFKKSRFGSTRNYVRKFPPLNHCRDFFSTKVCADIHWEDEG